MEPSAEYQPFMKVVTQKMTMCKIVIEFLTEEYWQKPTYEDLLQRLYSSGDPDITEELLIRHAHFICDQVLSIDANASDEEGLLITAPCMRALVKMAGVSFQKRYKIRGIDAKVREYLEVGLFICCLKMLFCIHIFLRNM